MEKIKESKEAKDHLDKQIYKEPKKVDYAGIVLGMAIIAIGYVVYEVILTTGYIVAFPIMIMLYGAYVLIKSF